MVCAAQSSFIRTGIGKNGKGGAIGKHGVISAVDPQSSDCGVQVDWSAGSTLCDGPLLYYVYRDTTTPVGTTPDNLIASNLTGTSLLDSGGLVSGTTCNVGLFALAEWATGSRWPAWGLAGVLCVGVGWFLRGSKPTTLFDGMVKAAVLTSPVVRAGGLHVLLPFLVLRPSVVWAAFPCAVLLLEAMWPDGDLPVRWLLVEYGALAAGLVLERAWRRRAVAKGEAG